MFTKIALSVISIFVLTFTLNLFSQDRATASYSLFPDISLTEESNAAISVINYKAASRATAYRKMLNNSPLVSSDMLAVNAEAVSYETVPVKTYSYHKSMKNNGPIRDFRDYYTNDEKTSTPVSAGVMKNTHPIRDFRADYWKNKYYRDEWHNKSLYKEAYGNYNYYN